MLKNTMLTLVLLLLFNSSALALQIGDAAPDFKARSTHGELQLSELIKQGPVILAFYYADFTPL